MIKFSDYTLKEILLFSSSFFMLVVLVLRDQLISPFILFFFVASLFFMKGQKLRTGRAVATVLMFFYFLHVLSLLYSENLEYAGADLMTKLSYLIFPLFILLVRTGFPVILRGIRWGLILGSAISMLFSLIRSFVLEGGFSGESFNANLYGVNMHASYLALIFIISGAFLLHEKLNWKGAFLVKIVYSLLVIVSIYYLRSLGAFICLAAILFILPVWQALKSRNWKWLLILPAYALIFFVGIESSKKIRTDIKFSLESVNNWSKSPDKYLKANVNNTESNAVRLVAWTLSADIISEHPFGVGIGDVKDVLNKSYRKHGYTVYADRGLNPHNQFFQTAIAIGWLGAFVLLIFFILFLYYAYKISHIALFVAGLCIFVSCLFESLLERQVGVILTGILVMYLGFYMQAKMNVLSEKNEMNEA